MIMAKSVTQIIETSDGMGGGSVTVIVTDDNGRQSTATENYYYAFPKADAIAKATEEALKK